MEMKNFLCNENWNILNPYFLVMKSPKIYWNSYLRKIKNLATLVDTMTDTQLFESNRKIRRLIEQGVFKVNVQMESNFRFLLQSSNCPYVIQVRKRIFRTIKNYKYFPYMRMIK